MAKANRCANSSCSAMYEHEEGKLFCLDIDLGNMAGEFWRKEMYLWLCAQCAREMKPKVLIAGNTVRLVLVRTKCPPVQGRRCSLSSWVN